MHKLGVDDVISCNFSQLREVPSVPLLQSHGIVVELFVKIFEEGDSLDDHSVDLIRGEGELITGHGMS